MENKIAPEIAEAEIADICREFDIDITPDQRAVIMPAIEQGRMHLDGEKIIYKLARPTEHIRQLAFTEPTALQIQRAGRGMKATRNNEGMEIDMGEASAMTMALLSAITGEALGLLGHIKKRDMKIIEVIVSFFN